MAIKLNKYAIRCEEIALASGRITPHSSAQPILYDISRNWRRSLEATRFQADGARWTEKEAVVGEIILSALAYLQRIGCKNIEQLLKDTIEQHARQIE